MHILYMTRIVDINRFDFDVNRVVTWGSLSGESPAGTAGGARACSEYSQGRAPRLLCGSECDRVSRDVANY